ncbi:DotH/IcmK family type IV secretion protein [Burkholderia sp. Tr-20390]|uniref:DotH/IcmK family type IV secretion protein n=1 Tax=Burkholderia sp. Tr-20390 TaxID=2703904 RepID=UPI0019826EAE|nr:DotH/IcmK family type IV secretion protein [Burkholderia sp. Tr-20390]MBN3729359.1 IcmK-like type IV secretion system protein [Burkholderia sp. Tr-20390]
MSKRIFLTAMTLIASCIGQASLAAPSGQGAGAQAQQSASDPKAPDVIAPNMDDATPPIPVTKEVIQRLVDDRNARVLTPRQIDSVRRTVDAARRAGVSPYPGGMIAEPRSRQIPWRPDVVKRPETIEMWQGTLSTFVFTDMSGNAWNIKSVSFDCNLFDDGRSCDGGTSTQGKAGASDATNMVSLQANSPYSYGNVVIRLDGLPTPIIFVLRTGKSTKTDMAIDVRVEARNPSAPPQLISSASLPAFDDRMDGFLSGVPPQGATAMKVAGGQAEAWMLNGSLYVRTRLSLLSPAFTDRVGSAEGISVYKYPRFVPSLLASVNGIPTSLLVSGN